MPRITHLACSVFVLIQYLCINSLLAGDSHAAERTIHLSSKQDYPQVATLPLPDNIDPNETIQFSPHRSRDINCHQISLATATAQNYIDVTSSTAASADPHMGSYDAHGAVNLNCMMQSNVPEPFGGGYKFTHLNMPGGQWSQNQKFMAQDMQSSHYTNLRQQVRSDWDKKGAFFGPFITTTPTRSYHSLIIATAARTNPSAFAIANSSRYATNSAEKKEEADKENVANEEEKKPVVESKQMQLKKAFKEYGSTIVVFHVGISLVSLGMFYTLVSRYVWKKLGENIWDKYWEVKIFDSL